MKRKIGGKNARPTACILSEWIGIERWRAALPDWRFIDIRSAPKQCDFTFVDGIGYSDKRFYHLKAKLKCRLDCKVLMDKAQLHEALAEAGQSDSKIGDAICKTFEVTADTVLPPGVWMIRSNLGQVGSKSRPVDNTSDLIRLYREWSNDGRGLDRIMASEYIVAPMLYHGAKFHLRIYVIIGVIGHPCAWMIRQGLLIPARAPYVAADWSNAEIHDTHGKDNPNVVEFPGSVPGHEIMTEGCVEVLSTALSALLPRVHNYAEAENGYELFGADIMFTSAGRPKIIEINSSPAIGLNTKKSLDCIFNSILATVFSKVFYLAGDPATVMPLTVQ